MKKHLINLIEQARERLTVRSESAVHKNALRASLNVMAVGCAFFAVALLINQPLRAELLKSLTKDSTELAADDLESATIENVNFNQQSFQEVELMPSSLLSPEILAAPVPSIAPLADRIATSQLDPQALDKRYMTSVAQQRLVAEFMANKYKAADYSRIREYVSHAMVVAKEVSLDPVLLVAVMAIESNFNPMARSYAGAQGLMQVMTSVHAAKYAPYGGVAAAFKPEANIRVGAYILKYYIATAGSLEGGLRYYVGGAAVGLDGGYAGKVLREREQIISILERGEITTASTKGNNDI